MPDYGAVSWDRLIDLRHHRYIEAFREKVNEMHNMAKVNDQKSVLEIAQEIKNQDLVEIARITRPNSRTNIVKMFVSNVPLPVPVNPLSLLFGIQEVTSGKKMVDRFGWLYFLLDIQDSTGN